MIMKGNCGIESWCMHSEKRGRKVFYSVVRDHSDSTITMWNFMSSGTGAALIPDDKKTGSMVTNVTVHI